VGTGGTEIPTSSLQSIFIAAIPVTIGIAGWRHQRRQQWFRFFLSEGSSPTSPLIGNA